MLVTFAVGLLAVSVSGGHQDGNALSLLQMSSAKVSVHADKECKAATKAHKDAKKKAKADKVAGKAAKAAWKAAKQAMQASKEAADEAYSNQLEACPVPEVDRSPDVGCSKTLITSTTLGANQPGLPLLMERGLPSANWYGFEEVLPGGGMPKVPFPTFDGGSSVFPVSTKTERNLGVAVMQPCSKAWTIGEVRYPYQVVDPPHATGTRTGRLSPGFIPELNGEVVYMRKTGFKSPCECRAWAETVMKWPTGAAVEFWGQNNGQPGQCTVFKMTEVPWTRLGFSLSLATSANTHMSCYLGNPEEWQERLDNEKATGHTVDKCSKTEVWGCGGWVQQANRTTRSTVAPIHVGNLVYPMPSPSTEAGRKMCLKWVKENPKCDNAIAIEMNARGCFCSTTVLGLKKSGRKEVPQDDEQICML